MSVKLAIISPNKFKYSETFIRMQIDHLPFDKVLYTDGYMPTSFSTSVEGSFESILVKRKWWKSGTAEQALTNSFKNLGVDIVLAHYGSTGVEVMNSCRKAEIPLIVHFHGYDAYRDDVMENQGKRYKELFEIASGIIAVSNDMYQRLVSLGCPEDKLFMIPYGVDTELFTSCQPSGSTFLSCGRFVKKKAPMNTIRAFQKVSESHSEAKLIMVGDGELLDEAKKMVDSLKLNEQVDFKGVCSQREISALFTNVVAYVQHSVKTEDNDSEGTPLAILEAMASGIPVIATYHAGIPDIVDSTTGILVSEGDINAMALAMRHLVEDKELAVTLGKNGRMRIEKHYTQEQYMDALSELIRDCCIEKQ